MERKYKAAIFDFDGTIVDSFPGIARSVRHALKETLGLQLDDLEPLKKFVGPPLHDSFRNMEGMDESGAEHAVQCFRDRYGRKGYRECELYDGILDMLNLLRESGIKTAVASSKAQDMLDKIIADKGITEYFDVVLGVVDTIDHESKADLVGKAARLLGAAPNEAVMVGDRYFDAEGAAENDIDFIGALYAGYGPREEFEDFPYVLLTDSPKEIGDYILSKE